MSRILSHSLRKIQSKWQIKGAGFVRWSGDEGPIMVLPIIAARVSVRFSMCEPCFSKKYVTTEKYEARLQASQTTTANYTIMRNGPCCLARVPALHSFCFQDSDRQGLLRDTCSIFADWLFPMRSFCQEFHFFACEPAESVGSVQLVATLLVAMHV